MAMETTGFIVEIGVCIVKFYTLDQGIQLRIKSEMQNHRLSDWYRISDAESQDYEKCEPRDLPHFKTENKDGACYVQLLAAKPDCSSLPERLRNKYKGVVWSPFLLYLDDKNGILENVPDAVAEVTVKYVPSGDKLFEIVSLVDWNAKPREAKLDIYWKTPWSIEVFASRTEPSNYLNRLNGCVNSNQYIDKNQQAIGICIVYKAENPVYKYLSKSDSPPPELTSYLWSQRFGLTRWLFRSETEDRANLIGRWFSHQRRPTSSDKKLRNDVDGNTHVLYNATAFNVFSVAARKKFNVTAKPLKYQTQDKYQLEIEVSFPFERKNIEIDWCFGEGVNVKKDAHFYDVELGKVQIYQRQGRIILEEVNNHFKELLKKEKVEYERAKKDVIIIDSTVIVHNYFLSNFKNYTKNKKGLFLVHTVNRIHYLHSGQTIWQKN